ncbi:MAG TPA: GlsB/YeaQ/YmgE family stress response membrane protein [Actinomycetota bacterium]|nr:GlsB/YeaQ/YmgE family stress response membrane protein [Actinomycetota bacterium]
MLKPLRFVVVGLFAGWLADELILGDAYGLFGNLVLGVVGGLVGGLLVDRLVPGEGRKGCLTSVVAAIVGATLFLLAVRFIRGGI